MTAAAARSAADRQDSILRINLRKFTRDRLAVAAAAGVVLFVAMALLAPWLAPDDPDDIETR